MRDSNVIDWQPERKQRFGPRTIIFLVGLSLIALGGIFGH